MDKMKIPGLGQSLEEITADYRAKAATEGMSPEVAKAAGWVKLGEWVVFFKLGQCEKHGNVTDSGYSE